MNDMELELKQNSRMNKKRVCEFIISHFFRCLNYDNKLIKSEGERKSQLVKDVRV